MMFLILMAGNKASAEPVTLRVGHFPNITHAQALIAHGLSRQGRRWFGERLGPDVKIEWFVYNAGPSAMEAIFADSSDLTYAWRSLMAAEIFVTILTGFGLGQLLHYGRELNAMDQVIGIMIVIVLIGLLANKALFARWERFLHRRWGTGSVAAIQA